MAEGLRQSDEGSTCPRKKTTLTPHFPLPLHTTTPPSLALNMM